MNLSADELLGRLRGVTGPELTPPTEPGSIAWLYWLFALLVVLSGALLFRRWPARMRSASDEALAALSTAASPPALDALVRKFLQSALGVPAERSTTAELSGRVSDEWYSILELIDQLRFSGARPDQPEMSGLLRRTEVLIQADGGEPAGRRTRRSGVNSH